MSEIIKREFSTVDASPSVLYVKKDNTTDNAYALTENMLNPGMAVPLHDTAELTYTTGDLTEVKYYLDGSVVATITLTYTSGNLTKVERT